MSIISIWYVAQIYRVGVSIHLNDRGAVLITLCLCGYSPVSMRERYLRCCNSQDTVIQNALIIFICFLTILIHPQCCGCFRQAFHLTWSLVLVFTEMVMLLQMVTVFGWNITPVHSIAITTTLRYPILTQYLGGSITLILRHMKLLTYTTILLMKCEKIPVSR